MLPDFGEDRQRKLRASSALVVGLGGLGSPAAIYLALAGIGRLGLLDSDVVELSNLHRQPLHTHERIKQPKTDSAAETLRALNPSVQLELHHERLSERNASDIIARYDIAIDASDNFPTRYLTNAVCLELEKPFVYGSVFRFEGEVAFFDARQGPCYRCLYPEPPPAELVPDCAQAGVIGILPGVVGLLQATEALKYLAGLGSPLIGRLLRYDALTMTFREIRFDRDPECPACGTTSAARNHVAPQPPSCAVVEEIQPCDLKAALDRGEPILLLDVREPAEHEFCRLPASRMITVGELDRRAGELPKDARIVVYCRSGCRGATATRLLMEKGFTRVTNLAGGILAWSEQVDPSVPRY